MGSSLSVRARQPVSEREMGSSSSWDDVVPCLRNLDLSSVQATESSPQDFSVRVINLPLSCSNHELIEFLEVYVGRGSVTGCRLQGNQSTGRAYVQFRTNRDATDAINLAKKGSLIFHGCRLKLFPANQPPLKPRYGEVIADNVRLHAGCLVQANVFYKLWTCEGCKIKIDDHRKRFYVLIFNASLRFDYKLEWPFRDIIDFYRCKNAREHTGETLVLRVWCAPRIYKQLGNQRGVFANQFSMGLPDSDHELSWTRTTDFTPNASIGESFVYCLEAEESYAGKLINLIKKTLGFQLHERNLITRPGSRYSINQQPAPILASPYLKDLPFDIVFLVNSLMQQGYIIGPGLTRSFFDLLIPSERMPLKYILFILKKLEKRSDTCFGPENWFKQEVNKFMRQPQKENLTNQYLTDGLTLIRRVFVTPSKIYCTGPEVEVSNRVTRHFEDQINDFLRVSFVEEDFDQMPFSALLVSGTEKLFHKHSDVYDRIVRVLKNGIAIGEKSFEFLAFSSSQLRDGSVWMFSKNANLTADGIRSWMGDFMGIRNVAKCAARMGQSFSSSTKSMDVHSYEVEMIPDVWINKGTAGLSYCFSDGIGKISAKFAVEVAKKCKLRTVPSLFQIRYGGFKGVVAIDPRSSYKLSLRKSMEKFPSSQIGLDILNWSRALPSYLNREIITLLSTLGVRDSVFENMQAKVIEQLDTMLLDPKAALDVIRSFNGDENNHQIIIEMLLGGFHPALEPFLVRMLHAFRANQLLDIQKKSRIFVSKGLLLMGCLDETRTLNYGEVYVSMSDSSGYYKFTKEGMYPETINVMNDVPQTACIVKGTVIVAKNPCLHPGDVRVLTAVEVPQLQHLVNCIVFPQKGHRPHPNECSGSDLDGDLYFVSWDESLAPPNVYSPQDYQSAPEQYLDRAVNTEDIIRYFADFIVNNSLGLICNAHVVFADFSPRGACSPECLELSKLCSIAVDFPKTGVSAHLPGHLRPTIYPDFMEKKDKISYESKKVIGKLFRAVINANKHEQMSSFTRQEAENCYDRQLEFNGFQDYLEEAAILKNCYDEMLLRLMYQYDVKSEAEIFTGHILSLSKWFRKRPGETKDRIRAAMSSLRKEVRSWLKNANGGDDGDDDFDSDRFLNEELKKASAWYHVTYHPDYVSSSDVDEKYGHLLSFPWVVYEKLVFIKKWAG